VTAATTKVRTPLFPLYSEVRALLPIWQGTSKALVLGLRNAFIELRGTPQDPVDWTDPDTWIRERLSDDLSDLAECIWTKSNKTVNPRHIEGSYLFINTYRLLESTSDGLYMMTERGRAFSDKDPQTVREIDEAEGLPDLLAILETKPQATRKDLIGEWSEFLLEYSNYRSPATINGALRQRLLNLTERGFVERSGNIYKISETGLAYAAPLSRRQEANSGNAQPSVLQAIRAHNLAARDALRAALSTTPPYAFEHLIRDLLEAMGYEDVSVTKASGDKGVDVLATVQFGITTITEVVQVKRHQGNIQRPVIDQLRGSLVYHGAIRGTVITLSGFSAGARDAALFQNAAPITLIDGEKLVDLLIEHEVGIRKRPVELYEVDEETFSTDGEQSALEVEG
jgi:restriction system protein